MTRRLRTATTTLLRREVINLCKRAARAQGLELAHWINRTLFLAALDALDKKVRSYDYQDDPD